MAKKVAKKVELTVEDKLRALYNLQLTDTQIDEIRKLRGELPLEVQDLEDEVAGLHTRIQNLEQDIAEYETNISHKNIEIDEATSLIKKYTEQQENVRNNREFNALTKEIEFKSLEIELAEKHIKEFAYKKKEKEDSLEEATGKIEKFQADLERKKAELKDITSETQKEESALMKESAKLISDVEERLSIAYTRIRSNVLNGLAVVTVSRDACGGCYNKIPPQRQLDIRSRKKIIVCEYCGRILIDKYINDLDNSLEKADMEAAMAAKTTKRKRTVRKSS